jgi:hypothetical protein
LCVDPGVVAALKRKTKGRDPMTDARSGRVNALAMAILDTNGDLALSHWVKTTGGPQLVRQIVKPLGVEVAA